MPEVLVAAALFSVELARGLPQPLRITRAKTAAGVSATSTSVIAVLSVLWLLYALVSSAWAAALSGTVSAALCFWTAVAVSRHSGVLPVLRAAAVAVLGSAAIIGGISLAASTETALGVLIVAGTAAYGVPRLYTGLRSPSLEGVSALYLTLSVFEALIFGVYGALGGYGAYVAYGVIQVASCVPVLVRMWLLRARRSRGEHPAHPTSASV